MRRFLLGAFIALAMAPATAGAQTATMGYADAAQAFAQACSRDIDRHCRQAHLGGGRIEACLQENAARVSQRCRSAVADIRARVAARLAAQQAVFRTCDRDSARLCRGISGEVNVLSCLNRARNAAGPTCNTAIVNAGWR